VSSCWLICSQCWPPLSYQTSCDFLPDKFSYPCYHSAIHLSDSRYGICPTSLCLVWVLGGRVQLWETGWWCYPIHHTQPVLHRLRVTQFLGLQRSIHTILLEAITCSPRKPEDLRRVSCDVYPQGQKSLPNLWLQAACDKIQKVSLIDHWTSAYGYHMQELPPGCKQEPDQEQKPISSRYQELDTHADTSPDL